jgi:hypothetical protein
LFNGNYMSTETEEIFGIRYQATTGEDTARWEDLVCAAVICKEHKSVRLLEVVVVTVSKSPVNPITNPNPLPSH